MKVWLVHDNDCFVVEFLSPTEKDFAELDGPDMEGQTSEYEVYCDRKLRRLSELLDTGCTYFITES